MTKTCTRCKTDKQATEFYKGSPASRSILMAECKACTIKRNSKHWYKNKHTSCLNTHLKRTFGITLGEYNEILQAQGGHCAICPSKPEGSRHGRLVVDHCHESGIVRGLLCDLCNRALGFLKDSPEVLEKAADYVRGFQGHKGTAFMSVRAVANYAENMGPKQ